MSGITPPNSFPLKYTHFSLLIFDRNIGTPPPTNLLSLKSKNSKPLKPFIVSGITPEKRLVLKSSFNRFSNPPIVPGSFPVKPFWLRSRTLRFFKFEKSSGMSPPRLFRESVASSRFVNCPKPAGILPETFVPVMINRRKLVMLPMLSLNEPKRDGLLMNTSSSRPDPTRERSGKETEENINGSSNVEFGEQVGLELKSETYPKLSSTMFSVPVTGA
ncbi:hypothetical protein LXL04_000916 [Taraxacum kok-saghyz]